MPNVVSTARQRLGLTAEACGVWLGEQLGRAPYPHSRVIEWERGVRSPRRDVREACAMVASVAVAERIINERLSVDEAAKAIREGMR